MFTVYAPDKQRHDFAARHNTRNNKLHLIGCRHVALWVGSHRRRRRRSLSSAWGAWLSEVKVQFGHRFDPASARPKRFKSILWKAFWGFCMFIGSPDLSGRPPLKVLFLTQRGRSLLILEQGALVLCGLATAGLLWARSGASPQS
jgi:hypothetical protein